MTITGTEAKEDLVINGVCAEPEHGAESSCATSAGRSVQRAIQALSKSSSGDLTVTGKPAENVEQFIITAVCVNSKHRATIGHPAVVQRSVQCAICPLDYAERAVA